MSAATAEAPPKACLPVAPAIWSEAVTRIRHSAFRGKLGIRQRPRAYSLTPHHIMASYFQKSIASYWLRAYTASRHRRSTADSQVPRLTEGAEPMFLHRHGRCSGKEVTPCPTQRHPARVLPAPRRPPLPAVRRQHGQRSRSAAYGQVTGQPSRLAHRQAGPPGRSSLASRPQLQGAG